MAKKKQKKLLQRGLGYIWHSAITVQENKERELLPDHAIIVDINTVDFIIREFNSGDLKKFFKKINKHLSYHDKF